MDKQRQIRVTPSKGEALLISRLAETWGESEAGILMLGFRRALGTLMSEYEQFQRIQGHSLESSPLRQLLIRLAAGEAVPEPELTLLAHDCALPIEVLKQIRDCLAEDKQRAATH